MQITRAHSTDEITQLEIDGRRLARQAACEGIVLLENDGALPLAPGRIALFGAGASMTVPGGTGSGEVNVRHSVSIREGLEAAGFELATAQRLDAYEKAWEQARGDFFAEQRAKLRHPSPKLLGELIGMEFRYPADVPVSSEEARALGTDTCVYVLSRQSGEGFDRVDEAGSFRLTEQERADIDVCAREFATTVVVLNVGAPIDVSWMGDIEGVNALVLMGQLGMEGGNALADILSGAESPSGKLAVTWPESIEQVPFSDTYGRAAADPDVADYAEGIFVGYRYYTTFDVDPAYPFGYGLSYTRFALDFTSFDFADDWATLKVDVQNVGGSHAGKYVVQAYVNCPEGKLVKERCRLVAFAKTQKLSPGETEEVVLRFSLRDLASYDEESAQTVLEPGDYRVSLGSSAASLALVGVLRVSERIVLEQHRNLCVASRPIMQLKPAPHAAELPQEIQIIEVSADEDAIHHEYGRPARNLQEVEDVLDLLDDSLMLKLCVGTGLGDEGEGFCTPGAVGHTTAALREAGVPNVELCDGPAGIRIQRRSAITAKGAIKPIDPPLSYYELLPAFVKRRMFGDADRDMVVYQNVTGFPAASSVAQTWNVELACEVGRTVGVEMAEYGVTYWLAPALNIVRNPLCGRNFEYYSEDPLISGKIAAAVARGVQSVPGRYACLKHFAANNQETNRNTSSSNVDERVLREIYLRGFEIAVHESQAASIMASYNKVNGIYATEHADLLTGILRDEWGFAGVVMTDWFATGFGHADECKALQAGVDLVMPGGKLPLATLKLGLKTGKLTRESLRIACARVLAKTLGAVQA